MRNAGKLELFTLAFIYEYEHGMVYEAKVWLDWYSVSIGIDIH